MVASGVASKGLDFNDIQHVIIFSMPKEIEDYVHQIGRTGRSGKTGIATSFVNMNTPEQTLLDLKYLLMEAAQKYVSTDRVLWITYTRRCYRVPPFLQTIEDPRAAQGGSLKGCPVCGGKFRVHSSGSSNCKPLMSSFRSGAQHFQLPKARGHPATADGFPPDLARHWRRILSSCITSICTH
jgi:ATP-dependent RNA helicase DDX41